MKLLAKIPLDKIEDDIKYLIIEFDEYNTKGYFLFFHKSLKIPCEWDLWFKDINDAKRQATFNYDLTPEDWIILEL